MKIQNKIERRIKDITTVTGEYPEEISVTREEFEQLINETDEVKDNIYRGIKLNIID